MEDCSVLPVVRLALNMLIEETQFKDGDADMIATGNMMMLGTMQQDVRSQGNTVARVMPMTMTAVALPQGAMPTPKIPVPRNLKDPSPVLHMLLVIASVGLFLGMVVVTTAMERAPKDKRAPANNIPMVQMSR